MQPSIESSVHDIFHSAWSITSSNVVPKTEDIVLRNGGRLVDATYVYADLAGSTQLAKKMLKETTAVIIRAYINSASRILRHYGGEIKSFDGDRVMAVFVGEDKNRKAVRAAFAINWAVEKVIRPEIEAKWTDVAGTYNIGHGIGIDTGEALIVRAGVRDSNDLISIGNAPNDAARLSELRSWTINITEAVYDDLSDELRVWQDGTAFFRRSIGQNPLGSNSPIFQSNGWWSI